MNCANGVGTLEHCLNGLAFNSRTYRCDWPDETDDCSPEGFLGFICPKFDPKKTVDKNGVVDPIKRIRHYKHPKTCKKYLVCDTGHPRLAVCGSYSAFNEETRACDNFKNVEGCAHEFSLSDYYNQQTIFQLAIGEDPSQITLEALRLNPFFKDKI